MYFLSFFWHKHIPIPTNEFCPRNIRIDTVDASSEKRFSGVWRWERSGGAGVHLDIKDDDDVASNGRGTLDDCSEVLGTVQRCMDTHQPVMVPGGVGGQQSTCALGGWVCNRNTF